jgi:hypothetical protein
MAGRRLLGKGDPLVANWGKADVHLRCYISRLSSVPGLRTRVTQGTRGRGMWGSLHASKQQSGHAQNLVSPHDKQMNAGYW